MRPRSATYPFCVLAALALSTAARAEVAFTCFPANHATRVNPDTHLVLTFSSPPTLGKSGQIRIYDAAGHHLVDTLDLSIPAGPDPSRRIGAAARRGDCSGPRRPHLAHHYNAGRENDARRSAQLPAHYHRRFG